MRKPSLAIRADLKLCTEEQWHRYEFLSTDTTP
jgi:hypothetical protein